MTHHYFSFQDAEIPAVEQLFDDLFSDDKHGIKEHLSDKELFDKTPVFQEPFKNENKTTLTSSGSGALRVISHALSLQTQQHAISFIRESAVNDDQFSYFMKNTKENCLFINTMAQQIHLIPYTNPSPLDIRLGALRQDINLARSYLADSMFIFLNINALKWSDAPAQSGNNPSGLTSEEANQLAYMAGQSHKNKFFIIYGFDHFDRDPHHLSLNSALQILWYYQFGAGTKAQPWPIPEDRRQDFTIESAMTSRNLLFRKDRITNNWFHKIPFELPSEHSHHQWIACSHDEYRAASNEDLPHRLVAWYEILDPD